MKTDATDAEMAAEFKQRLLFITGETVDLMNEAKGKNFVIDFQIARDPTGRAFVQSTRVVKEY